MTKKYYQGEDIIITIELYDSEQLNSKKDISDYRVDLLLTTANNFQTVYCSTDVESSYNTVEISRLNDYTLSVNIGSKLTSKFNRGIAIIEVRVTDQDGVVSINSISSIAIENSYISQFS